MKQYAWNPPPSASATAFGLKLLTVVPSSDEPVPKNTTHSAAGAPNMSILVLLPADVASANAKNSVASCTEAMTRAVVRPGLNDRDKRWPKQGSCFFKDTV